MIHLIAASVLLFASAEEVDLLSAVPSDAQIVFHVESVRELRSTFRKNAWGRFFHDPEMEDICWAFLSLLGDGEEIDEAPEGLSPSRLWNTVSGGIVLTVNFDELDSVNGTLLIEPGVDRDAFDEDLDAMLRSDRESDSISDSVVLYNGEEIHVLTSTDDDSDGMSRVYCDTGTVVVLGFSTEAACTVESVQKVVDSLKDDGTEECLLDSDRFTNCREAGGGPGMVEVYVDAAYLTNMCFDFALEGLEEEVRDAVDMILDEAGVNDISALYLRTDVGEGEELEGALFIGIEGEGSIRSLIDCFSGPLPREMFELCPARSLSAAAIYFDVSGLYTRLLDFVGAYSMDALQRYRDTYDSTIKKKLGIDPEKEILALLDGRFGGYIPLDGDGAPEGSQSSASELDDLLNRGDVLYVGLKDVVLFQANLDRTLRAFGLHVSLRKDEFLGHTIYSLAVPGVAPRVNWVFGTDLAAVSLYPPALRTVIRLMTRDGQTTVASRKEVAAIFDQTGGVGSVLILDTACVLQDAFSEPPDGFELRPDGVAVLREEGEGSAETIELILPSYETVEKYFRGVYAWHLTVDKAGLHVRITAR